MKLHLTFQPSDFATMRTFDTAVKKQLGPNVYTGTDSLCFYMEYPPALKAMLRPNPANPQLEFDLESSVTTAR
jgi:hypothetical protein